MQKKFTTIALLVCLNISIAAYGKNIDIPQQRKYPDYSYTYAGNDRFENFNRKMFTFNGALNKCAIRPIHTVWASVMPQYGMDRIQNATTNIEYPIRLMSTIIQRDFKASGRETVRFLTNTTIGLGGMYDPAKKLFKMDPIQEDMEQALAKCKVKSGPYLVIPIMSSTTPRNIAGKILDAGLNPSSYVASPVLAMVKAGIFVNRTSYMQPISKMIESTYADPYEIAKKLYSIERHIRIANFDRKEVLDKVSNTFNETQTALEENNIIAVNNETEKVAVSPNQLVDSNKEEELKPDLELPDYFPQHPVTDSMRTALFELPGINDSIWNELSVWNRCFSKSIKTASVKIFPNRDRYSYRYIMQKDKNSPVAIIYPSIGEGITSHHSIVMAKLFYDLGYSIIIQGSHFQWEFVKSMPEDYRPGLPSKDADLLRDVTSKIVNALQNKYKCDFKDKILIGTSFGAMTALFIADKEEKNPTLGISKFISINPPIELLYAIKEIDKNSEQWSLDTTDLKERTALTAAKIVDLTQQKKAKDFKISQLPFSEYESKLITGFIMHQKLSDLIFTLEKAPQNKKSDIYEKINDINYHDYAQKYLLKEGQPIEEIAHEASLHSIKDYLQSSDNYKIYHALDDYLVNKQQLAQLKKYTGQNTVLVSNGGHLGYLYRQEFIDELKKEILPTIHQIAEK